MEEKKLVPKLRFPGFTEPWEQRKLGDLADGVFGGGTPKTSIDTYWNGSIPWIQSSNLMDDKIENFINDKSITNLAIKESATKLIPANSIAIVTRVGVGKVALIREKFATSQDFLSFYCRHEHNPLFMAYQISRLMKVKSRLLQGTSIKGITKSEVLESEVLIPKGAEEEIKIADFLSSCDTLITLHQRKLEHLKLKKKSLLQKLFPKEGEVYPELRFPGFTNPWEQRKFKSLFQKNLERNDGQFPFNKTISISRMIYSESGNGANTESLDNYKVLRVGDIAFEGHENKDFKFGRFVMNDVGNGIMSPRFTFLRPLIDMELNFWKEYINYEPIMQKKLVYSTKKGTMMNELVIEDFLNQYVAVPSIQEQQKIGYLLKCMTDDITLHQRKLEHLQLLKKALLQQLFV